MVDKKLLDYVNSALKSGHSADDIRETLLREGWKKEDVDEAMSLAAGIPAEERKISRKEAGSGGSRRIYIAGAVAIILIVVVTAFYILSLPPGKTGPVCGNGICESGETYETCPQDCEEAEIPSGPATLSFSPSVKSVGTGETFTIDLRISNAKNLFGFQFDLEYDPNILEFMEATEGGFISRNGNDNKFCVEYKKNESGLVKDIACTRLGSGSVEGGGVLEKITFRAIGPGTTKLKILNVKLASSEAEKLESEVLEGEVTVS